MNRNDSAPNLSQKVRELPAMESTHTAGYDQILPLEESEAAKEARARQHLKGPGLSARLMILTLVFAVCAQALVFVPSVTAFRRSWLNDRLAAAQIAALVLEATPGASVSPAIEEKLLDGVGVMGMALSSGGARHLLANDSIPTEMLRTIDLRDVGWVSQMRDTLDDLLLSNDNAVRVIGDGKGDIEFVELIMDPQPLRSAMVAFSIRVALVSLAAWGVAAASLYLALMRLIVRPVRRLAEHITAFEREPSNPDRIIVPSGSRDEIGQAERALERMEHSLAAELRQQQRLAALGLAVAKISHELRNMLTTAQLISDRLAQVADPVVDRFAPRLIATLDRAIAYCESALAYGRVAETLPQRRQFRLRPLVEELRDNLGLESHTNIKFVMDIPDHLTLIADSEQLSRVMLNLGRNAVQALEQDLADSRRLTPSETDSDQESTRTITISAHLLTSTAQQEACEEAIIRVADDGPGLAVRARERLFEAFHGTTRPGGSGLGLAIAAELIRLHGGNITLEPQPRGTCFVIRLPQISG